MTQENIDELANSWAPPSGGGDMSFLKINPGQTVRVRLLTDKPTIVKNHAYIEVTGEKGKVNAPVTVPENLVEKVQASGVKLKELHVVPVFDYADGNVKLWTVPFSGSEQIQNTVKTWKKRPTEFDLNISRTGSGKLNTKYAVTPIPSEAPIPEGLKLPNLLDYYAPSAERVEALLRGELPKKKDDSGEAAAQVSGEAVSVGAPAPTTPLPETTGTINPIEGGEVL